MLFVIKLNARNSVFILDVCGLSIKITDLKVIGKLPIFCSDNLNSFLKVLFLLPFLIVL